LVANPIYEDEVPENLPGPFALCHITQATVKEIIIKAQEFAYTYLCCAMLREPFELTCETLKNPRILKVILLLENLFKEIRILHDYEEIKALLHKPEVLFLKSFFFVEAATALHPLSAICHLPPCHLSNCVTESH